MYYSPSASLYCALSIDEIRAYPVKGGTLRYFDPNAPAQAVEVIKRLMPRDIPLARFNDTAQEVRFTKKWDVLIGTAPNGNENKAEVFGV